MKRHSLPITLLAATVALAGCSEQETPLAPQTRSDASVGLANVTAAGPETTGNHLVVMKRNDVPAGVKARVEALGGRIVSEHGVVGALLVAGLDDAAVETLKRESAVRYVEPEPVIYLPEPQGELELAAVEMDLPASPEDPAGAFFWGRQWHMRAIHADQAWAAGFLGSEDVTVAILDTGIDYLYPDLAGRVDLSRSISLRPEDDALVAEFFPDRHPITDLGYHGTHVAATVASNGLVGAGVTSKTTLMGVKVCSVYGGCIRIFEAIEYAVENGADIINMSLGGHFQKRNYPGYVSIINRYFTYAHREGVLLVVSAGNEAADLDHNIHPDADDVMQHMPSLYKTYCDAPNVACVSATGPTNYTLTGPWENIDAPADYTNYGRSAISVAAPGGYESFVYAGCSQTSLLVPICQTGNYILGMTGTSMAAPHVSGLAAMVMAEYGTGRPSQTRNFLQQTADDLGQPGTDPFYGKGRINAATAMGLN